MWSPFKKKQKSKSDGAITIFSVDDRDDNAIIDFNARQATAIKNCLTNGDMREIDDLFRSMKAGWPRLRKNLNEVTNAVAGLDLEVMPWAEKGAEVTPQDRAIAELIESVIYRATPSADKWELGLSHLRASIAESFYRSTGVVEIIWEKEGEIIYPKYYVPVTSKFFRWSSSAGEQDRLVLCPDGVMQGEELMFPENKFIITIDRNGHDHPVHGGILIPLISYYGASKFGLRWFMSFCQLYGIPWRHIKADTEPERVKAIKAMAELGASGIIATSEGVEIEVFDTKSNGQNLPQRELIDLADRACDNLILGQELTSGTGRDGAGSRALGEVHNSVRTEAIASISKKTLEVINEQLIPSIIKLNFGYLPKNLPYLVYKTDNTESDENSISKLERAIKMGIIMSREYVYDTLKISPPRDGEQIFEPQKTVSSETDSSQVIASSVQKKDDDDGLDDIDREIRAQKKTGN